MTDRDISTLRVAFEEAMAVAREWDIATLQLTGAARSIAEAMRYGACETANELQRMAGRSLE